MTRAPHWCPAALVLVAAVSACGSATPPPLTPTPSASPVTGTSIDAGAFTTVVPEGWQNTINDASEVQKLGSDGKVLYLVEAPPPGKVQPNVNDVRANINVVQLTQMVPDDQVITYLGSVSNNGATNLSSAQPFTVDGAMGQYITYDRDIQGTPGESRDMLVNHAGVSYHIVLNTSQFAFTQQLAGLQALLTSWKWSSA